MRRGWRSCALVVALLAGAAPVATQQRPDRATVPLVIEKNRPYINITFRLPDGSTRSGRFLVDAGGGGFLITEPLARSLGLEWGASSKEEGSEFALVGPF